MQRSMLDNLALSESPNLVGRDSQQFTHDLVGGVAQRRTKIGDAPWRFRKCRYDVGNYDLTQTFLFDVSEVPAYPLFQNAAAALASA